MSYETKSGGAVTLAPGGGGTVVVGYASPFGPPPDSVGDIVAPGAYRLSIQSRPKIPFLWGHDVKEVCGVIDLMTEDQTGLAVRGRVFPTSRGKDALALLEGAGSFGLSIGYNPVKTSRLPGGLRSLDQIDLLEVSFTPIPAAARAYVTLAPAQKAHLADILEVAALFQASAEGLQLHPRQGKDAAQALQREIERLQFDGRTWAEYREYLLAEIAHERAALRKVGA